MAAASRRLCGSRSHVTTWGKFWERREAASSSPGLKPGASGAAVLVKHRPARATGPGDGVWGLLKGDEPPARGGATMQRVLPELPAPPAASRDGKQLLRKGGERITLIRYAPVVPKAAEPFMLCHLPGARRPVRKERAVRRFRNGCREPGKSLRRRFGRAVWTHRCWPL